MRLEQPLPLNVIDGIAADMALGDIWEEPAMVRLIAKPPRFHSRISPGKPSLIGSVGITSKTEEHHSRLASN